MAELMRQSGLHEPELADQGHSFTIRFMNADHAEPETTSIPDGLSEVERELLAILGERGPLAIGDLERSLAGSLKTATDPSLLECVEVCGACGVDGRIAPITLVPRDDASPWLETTRRDTHLDD